MSSRNTLSARIRDLGPWFHNLRIEGMQTAPDHPLGDYPRFKWQGFRHVIPEDLSGKTVLDIGCNAGFYAIEMAQRGAKVTAIDADPHYLAQARFAAEAKGVDIDLRQMDVYEVAKLGRRFDLVIFMGVLYHLRHPLLALDLIYKHVAGDMMLFQCMQRGSMNLPEVAEDYPFQEWDIFNDHAWPRLNFIEHRYAGDPTNWFIPNRAGMEAMLRSAGFVIDDQPEPEVYLCHCGDDPGHPLP
ncbi:TIGR04290 family methyltransferase [Paracoccus beibuensis]|uniref:TIGR04290 family methyltransferase n=1 Tax=Paracoccus beibuensis TaxID=547602 RepID=UPI0022408670|nr:TIGR04290 family methyltransferase [Paracoccus beibuensis]